MRSVEKGMLLVVSRGCVGRGYEMIEAVLRGCIIRGRVEGKKGCVDS